MPGIGNLKLQQYIEQINGFSQKYVDDWDAWLDTAPQDRSELLGRILRKWQACRPNSMRRIKAEAAHNAPYLEDLVAQAAPHIEMLQDFNIQDGIPFVNDHINALAQLWDIFQNLSHDGRANGGRTGVVGISKAVLLLTDGRVGPAFDKCVKKNIGVATIFSAEQWIEALYLVSKDISNFERKNDTTLQAATPQPFAELNAGRIYDMALGPR